MRNIIFILGFALSSGCMTPPEVREPHAKERLAFVQGKKDVQTVYDAISVDLELAWQKAVERVAIYDAMLNAKDGKVDIKLVTLRLRQAMLRLKIATKKIRLYQSYMRASFVNFDVGLQLHDKIGSWMGRRGLSEVTQQEIITETSALAQRIGEKVDEQKLKSELEKLREEERKESDKIAREGK